MLAERARLETRDWKRETRGGGGMMNGEPRMSNRMGYGDDGLEEEAAYVVGAPLKSGGTPFSLRANCHCAFYPIRKRACYPGVVA